MRTTAKSIVVSEITQRELGIHLRLEDDEILIKEHSSSNRGDDMGDLSSPFNSCKQTFNHYPKW